MTPGIDPDFNRLATLIRTHPVIDQVRQISEQPVYLVGEAKLQIDERRENRRGAYEVFDQLERQTRAVAEQNPGYRIVPLLVTHYARPALLREAESRGVLVVQSFEW